MTSAKACSSSGLVAVSRHAAIAAGAPPAIPLFVCSVTLHDEEAAMSASARRGRSPASSNRAGNHIDS
jgi:hypothetical protein